MFWLPFSPYEARILKRSATCFSGCQKFSSDSSQAPETEGKKVYRLPSGKREEPSYRMLNSKRYLFRKPYLTRPKRERKPQSEYALLTPRLSGSLWLRLSRSLL